MIMALIFLSLLVSTFVAGCGIDQRKRDGRTGTSPVKDRTAADTRKGLSCF